MRVLLLVFLLLLPVALADDDGLQVGTAGDGELQVMFVNSYDQGTAAVPSPEEPPAASGGSGGSSVANVSPAKFYDVLVHMDKSRYTPGATIRAELSLQLNSILNPQNDGVLEYTLISPSGKRLASVVQTVKEGTREKILEYHLPDDAELGQWTLETVWTVPELAPMKSTASFQVMKRQVMSPLVLIALGIIALCIIGAAVIARRRANL